MNSYLVSLVMGLAVGAAYGLVRTPLSGSADDRPRWPVPHGASATRGPHDETPFRAVGSHHQQARCEQRQGFVRAHDRAMLTAKREEYSSGRSSGVRWSSRSCRTLRSDAAPIKTQFNKVGGLRTYISSRDIGRSRLFEKGWSIPWISSPCSVSAAS
jgi:hypothetical protein